MQRGKATEQGLHLAVQGVGRRVPGLLVLVLVLLRGQVARRLGRRWLRGARRCTAALVAAAAAAAALVLAGVLVVVLVLVAAGEAVWRDEGPVKD